MDEIRTGAVILAAGKAKEMDDFRPMMKLGQSTMIKRELDILRENKVSPIVVIAGHKAKELSKHLAHRGVIIIENGEYECSHMLDSVKLGISELKDKVDRVLIMPSDVPMVGSQTVAQIMKEREKVTIPVYDDCPGHPVMIHKDLFDYLAAYEGPEGLKGAFERSGAGISYLPVEDKGILMDTNTEEDYKKLLAYEKETRLSTPLTPKVSVALAKQNTCMDEQLADFLEAVEDKGSILSACEAAGVSYSKAWKMIKTAEDELGFPFLERVNGGADGGYSVFTEEGKAYLRKYRDFKRKIEEAAEAFFREMY